MSDRPDGDRVQDSSAQMKIAIISGVFGLAVAVITGVFTLAAMDGDEPKAEAPSTAPPATTPSTSVELTATATDKPLYVSITATRHRPPRAGYSYWLVMRVRDVNGHSEYYPRKDLTFSATSESFTLDIPPDATVSPRSVQVYEVSNTDVPWMAEALGNPDSISQKHLVNPPCGGSCSVSNVVQLPFKQ